MAAFSERKTCAPRGGLSTGGIRASSLSRGLPISYLFLDNQLSADCCQHKSRMARKLNLSETAGDDPWRRRIMRRPEVKVTGPVLLPADLPGGLRSATAASMEIQVPQVCAAFGINAFASGSHANSAGTAKRCNTRLARVGNERNPIFGPYEVDVNQRQHPQAVHHVEEAHGTRHGSPRIARYEPSPSLPLRQDRSFADHSDDGIAFSEVRPYEDVPTSQLYLFRVPGLAAQ